MNGPALKMPRPTRTTSDLINELEKRIEALEQVTGTMDGWHFRSGVGGTLEVVRSDGAVKGRFQ